MPVVGYLDFYAAEPTGIFLAAFRKGLSETGFIEGRNLAIEYRYANTEKDRLPQLVADLIQRRVAVIVTPFGTAAALAAKNATTTIAIIFMSDADPTQTGLVASYNRPGGNVTGLSLMNVELGAKRLGLLHELIPKAERVAAFINPNSAIAEPLIREAHAGASNIGWQVEAFTLVQSGILMWPSQVWSKSEPTQFSSVLTISSPPGEYSSPLLRRTIVSPPFIRIGPFPKSAA